MNISLEAHLDALEMERNSIIDADPLAGKPCENCTKYALDCGVYCDEQKESKDERMD